MKFTLIGTAGTHRCTVRPQANTVLIHYSLVVPVPFGSVFSVGFHSFYACGLIIVYMDRFNKTDRILEGIDRGLEAAGSAPDTVAGIEGSVLDELNEDEKCGFITGDEKELIFRAWRGRYRADQGNVSHIKPNNSTPPPNIAA